MLLSEFCNPNLDAKNRRYYVHKRRLEMLTFYRDSLERRIAAINASIQTLEDQIQRDEN